MKKKCVFGIFLWSNWPQKIWLFPNIYDNAFHTLSKAQKGLKKGFCSIIIVGRTKILILKCFFAFFGLKLLKLISKTQKKLLPMIIKVFLADFFLSLFQISDVKQKPNTMQKWYFLGWKPNFKKFSKVIFVPKSKLCEKFGLKWPGFYGGQNIPPCHLGCILDAAPCRVTKTFLMKHFFGGPMDDKWLILISLPHWKIPEEIRRVVHY